MNSKPTPAAALADIPVIDPRFGTRLEDMSADQFKLEKFNAAHRATVITSFELMDKVFPEPTWAVPGIIPEGLTIMSGKPKTGKSWLALNIAVAASLGGNVLGEIKVDKLPVLYLALEDTPRRLQNRLNHIEALPSKDLVLATRWDNGKDGLKKLINWIKEYTETKLVIIDTLAKFRGISHSNGTQYEIDYQAVNGIKQFSDELGFSVILLHHTRKMASDDYLEEVSGTMGITGAADTVLVLKRSRGQADAELCVTGRDLEDQELALEFRENIGWTIMGDAQGYRYTKERQEVLSVLQEASEPLSSKEIAEVLGHKPGNVRRLIMKLHNDGLIKREEYGKYVYAQLPI